MNGEQNNQQNNPQFGEQNNPQNANFGEQSQESQFTQKPPPEVNIRSMESDKKSIESGESSPVPESVIPPQDKKEPEFRPETQASDSFEEVNGNNKEKPKTKKWLIWLVIIILIIGVLAIIYFFVLPKDSKDANQEPPPAVLPPPPAKISHRSLFNPKPAAVSEIRLNNVLIPSITSAMQALAANRLALNTVQEVSIFDNNGSQIPFSVFAAQYINSLTSAQISNWFEDDFTAFLYYDEDGVWPGYVAKIKNGVNLDSVKANLTVIETSDIGKFYLSPPGTFSEFNHGSINDKSSRYSVGSAKGASFNYLFANNQFVISASFNGLKAVAPLLGI